MENLAKRTTRLGVLTDFRLRFLAASMLLSLFGGTAVAGGAVTATASPAAAPQSESFTALADSSRSIVDADVGHVTNSEMTVEVVLAPSDPSALSDVLAKLYDPQSATYHQWLATGEFYTRFAPNAAQVSAISEYLQSQGLVIEPSVSPFLLRVSGPSGAIETAFRTTLESYRNPKGTTYFRNASAIQLPTRLAAGVLGVVGVSNTVRMRSHARLAQVNGSAAAQGSLSPSCEAGYPTRA
jgi:subtilase family serine protease